MPPYAIGLDFGTESARLVLIDTSNGSELLVCDQSYRHGVIDQALPNGRRLPAEWALQHPADYLAATETLLRAAAEAVDATQIIGSGIGFTASTGLPGRADGTPLCMVAEFAGEPHAYVKLWKHHAAAAEAAVITASGGRFLEHTGGDTSPEWLHAKALETMNHAPHVFAAAERFLEAGDWLVWQLCGREVRSACQAGFKAHYRGGYPAAADLDAIASGFGALNSRLAEPQAVGTCAGGLMAAWAERSGVPAGTPVGVAVIDAHAAVPGLGVTGAGVLAIAMGTSTCHILLAEHEQLKPGIAGVVYEGVYPGLYAYETGQAAAGDMLAWWVRLLAGEPNESMHYDELEAAAAQLAPGGRGILALDWWNGARTPLMDPLLSGVLVGLRVETQPAEIYRALLEAIAFGNRQVIELLEAATGPIREVRVGGGLSRSTLLMQILADVCGREILVSPTPHASARGAAIYGALAAGIGSVADVCARMAPHDLTRYAPTTAHTALYHRRYALYRELQRHFGEGGSDLLYRLRSGT